MVGSDGFVDDDAETVVASAFFLVPNQFMVTEKKAWIRSVLCETIRRQMQSAFLISVCTGEAFRESPSLRSVAE